MILLKLEFSTVQVLEEVVVEGKKKILRRKCFWRILDIGYKNQLGKQKEPIVRAAKRL